MLFEGSRGVPRPSVFMVSTLLARERSMGLPLPVLWEERFEGARPKSWRRRRYMLRGGSEAFEDVGALGLVLVRWWWARREEMAEPREESSDADGGGSLIFAGEIGLGGEELGVISCNGAEMGGAARVAGESLSKGGSGGARVPSSK